MNHLNVADIAEPVSLWELLLNFILKEEGGAMASACNCIEACILAVLFTVGVTGL